MDSIDLVECPRCGGKQQVMVFVLYPRGPVDSFWDECPSCNGAGKVDKLAAAGIAARMQETEDSRYLMRQRVARRSFYRPQDGDEVVIAAIDF